jgi:hypothetical protein
LAGSEKKSIGIKKRKKDPTTNCVRVNVERRNITHIVERKFVKIQVGIESAFSAPLNLIGMILLWQKGHELALKGIEELQWLQIVTSASFVPQ